VVTFEARVNDGVPTGTRIINQGRLTSNELPQGATDADGVPSNGNQPTVVVVGAVQLLTITKEVSVVGANSRRRRPVGVCHPGEQHRSLPATRWW